MTLGNFPILAAMLLLLRSQRPIIPRASALLLQSQQRRPSHGTHRSSRTTPTTLSIRHSVRPPSRPLQTTRPHHRRQRFTPPPLGAIESRELRFFNSSPVLDDIIAAAAANNGSSRPGDNHGLSSLTISGARNAKEAYFFFSSMGLFPSSSAALAMHQKQQQQRRRSSGSNGSGGGGDGTEPAEPLRDPQPSREERKGKGPSIDLTEEEMELFHLLQTVNSSTGTASTLRVAGGWVRDKLLATEDFQTGKCPGTGAGTGSNSNSGGGGVDRLTSKFKGPSMGRKGGKIIGGSPSMSLIDQNDKPVDIDVALDDMLGREFADYLNDYLTLNGREKLSVGVVLKNPEKSKHLETATMKVGKFWVDFVNLRAEEYTNGSRIPDLMRIGTAVEDAYRRDLTINALFYNINTRQVEDITGRGFDHLRKGVIATPLPALTTLLDDPLRVLRSVRFAARLRFTMDDDLRNAAQDEKVRVALAQKVARERIGSEVDLMLRSQDPVGAMRLLINLKLVGTVFPVDGTGDNVHAEDSERIFGRGLDLLSTTHDHLCHCKANKPFWCETKHFSSAATYHGVDEIVLINDDEARRRLWYAAFLKPLKDHVQDMKKPDKAKVSRRQGKKAKRSAIMKLMVDELKRPLRDADAVEVIMKAADDFTNLLDAGCDLSSMACLLGEVNVIYHGDDDTNGSITCHMGKRVVNSDTEDDPLWLHAMEHRLLVSKVLARVGPLWRAALILSLSEQLLALEHDLSYTIEGDVFEETHAEKREGIIQNYDAFAATMLHLGLIGIWSQEPLIDGREITTDGVLPKTPRGPIFREIMEEQASWMTTHPGGKKMNLIKHLQKVFPEFV